MADPYATGLLKHLKTHSEDHKKAGALARRYLRTGEMRAHKIGNDYWLYNIPYDLEQIAIKLTCIPDAQSADQFWMPKETPPTYANAKLIVSLFDFLQDPEDAEKQEILSELKTFVSQGLYTSTYVSMNRDRAHITHHEPNRDKVSLLNFTRPKKGRYLLREETPAPVAEYVNALLDLQPSKAREALLPISKKLVFDIPQSDGQYRITFKVINNTITIYHSEQHQPLHAISVVQKTIPSHHKSLDDE